VWWISLQLSPLLDDKLGKLTATIESVLSQVTSQAHRLTEVEERVSTLEDTVNPLQTQLDQQNTIIQGLTDKLDDLENRSRRNNLRIIGLPEAVKGPALQEWASVWLPSHLGYNIESCPVAVERVHRLGPDLNSTAGRPRPVIMLFLNYTNKTKILQAYYRLRNLDYQGATLQLFQDFSAALSTKRRAFSSLCSKLVAQNIRFSLLYPARLLVVFNGTTHYFDTPREAAVALLQDESPDRGTSLLSLRSPVRGRPAPP
uniref:Uncharacterized protein n=1 Tax=Leptobrachium leishanense TaxID=445787 RepID=A0A8C5QRW1_9ANUR